MSNLGMRILYGVMNEMPGVWCERVFAPWGDMEEEMRQEGSHPRCEATDELLSMLDVLVDGRFVEALKDISLRFRGSSNQRLIDMKKTLASGEIVLLPDLDRKPGQA